MQVFFPQRRCPACGTVTGDASLCDVCAQKQHDFLHCMRCGSFLHPATVYCETCAFAKKWYFERAVCAFPYEGYFAACIIKLKYRGKTYYKRPFAVLLCELVQREYADIVFDMMVPVPAPPQRFQQRGYNQVSLYAEPAAFLMELVFDNQSLYTIKENPSLVGQKRKARFALVRGTFEADCRTVADKTVLLIDDVFTTGATVNACAMALKKSGAKAVYVATLAGHFVIN